MRTRHAIVAVLLSVGAAMVAAQAPRFDLVIRGARVVDGTGAPWVLADVAIAGDTIVAVGRDLAGTAATTVDAAGKVVAPGFIDIHTHAPRHLRGSDSRQLRQAGVTTVVEGPDGSSPLPIAAFL
jgi:N-acyl-D-aspartate/D-glutamate deacylase